MSLVGVASTALIIVLFTARNDRAGRLQSKDACIEAIGGAALYAVVWTITLGNYLFSVSGNHLAALFDKTENNGKTFVAQMLAALVCCVVYAIAIIVGSILARRYNARINKTK